MLNIYYPDININIINMVVASNDGTQRYNRYHVFIWNMNKVNLQFFDY